MTVTDALPAATHRPPWGRFALGAFVALVVCSNIAGFTWAKLLTSSPETLLALSSRNRYLVLALGADVSIVGYWVIGFARIALAFAVCHLVGRAYSGDVLSWFTRYLGFTPEGIEQFNRSYRKAEWFVVPFFTGSNLVAALSGIHRTPPKRLALLVSVGILGRLVLLWWLARLFDDQLTDFVGWLQKYSWWAVGVSFALIILVNMRNLKRGAAD